MCRRSTPTTGDLVWEYRRKYPEDLAQKNRAANLSRGKNLAMFDDMVFFAAPDGFIVALDAQTGKVRWETKAHDYTDGTEHSGGLLVADGKIISNRACRRTREGCFIAAHDAKTGKELWKFYNTASPDEPGGDTWGNLPADKRLASSWGLPGSYDPKRKVVYWAVANPTPYTRLEAARQRRCRVEHLTVGALQQLDRRARHQYRQARLVLPAPSRRRLGFRPYPRAYLGAHQGLTRSESL